MDNDKQLQIVTFEQARRLKALGFDWKCTDYYNDHEETAVDHPIVKGIGIAKDIIPAPTVALALKWLRDVKGYKASIHWYAHNGLYGYSVYSFARGWASDGPKTFIRHEEAESALLDAVLDVLEKGAGK